MVNVINRRCSCGKCIPYFGMPGGRATHCKECKEQGMVDVINRRCSCGKCVPSFGMPGGNATHCKECKEQGMVNVTDDRFKLDLSPRAGCRIQRWPTPSGQVRWQAWYPPNGPGEKESISVTADGEAGFQLVLSHVWEQHRKFLEASKETK